jgi:hypothetical protein
MFAKSCLQGSIGQSRWTFGVGSDMLFRGNLHHARSQFEECIALGDLVGVKRALS